MCDRCGRGVDGPGCDDDVSTTNRIHTPTSTPPCFSRWCLLYQSKGPPGMTKPKTYHVYHERSGIYYQLSERIMGPSGMAYAIVMVSLDGTLPPLLSQHSPPHDADTILQGLGFVCIPHVYRTANARSRSITYHTGRPVMEADYRCYDLTQNEPVAALRSAHATYVTDGWTIHTEPAAHTRLHQIGVPI
ncbi:MAG: hypothetical protein AAGF95_33105 [Chloroflexota bacterium]